MSSVTTQECMQVSDFMGIFHRVGAEDILNSKSLRKETS